MKRLNNFLSAKELTNYITPKCSSPDNCIELDNCSFRWSKTPPPSDSKKDKKDKKDKKKEPEESRQEDGKVTLSNININIKPGSFVAIVGAVGSGKSSILNSILGNMELLKGTISV